MRRFGQLVSTALPALYEIKHPTTPWQVSFRDPVRGRVRKHFKLKGEAEEYHRKLLVKAKVSGTAGLVMDATMRDEYFAAVKALGRVSLAEAVRFYLKHHPPGRADRPMLELVEEFLSEKAKAARAPRTLQTLRSRLMGFMAEGGVEKVSGLTRESLNRFLQSLDLAPLTRRNYHTDLSSFCGWLHRKKVLPENPLEFVDRPKVDPPLPRVLTPEQAGQLMAAAVEHRNGRFALYFAILLFAGLRPGEVERLQWSDIHLADGAGSIRVHLGKKRGRRSVRVVPLSPILAAWLEWGSGRELVPQPVGTSRHVRALVSGIKWQADICRHSWISYRLAQTNDENLVAREAGNTPDVIYRHYFQLTPQPDALRFFAILPPSL